jgi:formiminotetrahydrofolate cyclodeaminase
MASNSESDSIPGGGHLKHESVALEGIMWCMVFLVAWGKYAYKHVHDGIEKQHAQNNIGKISMDHHKIYCPNLIKNF